MATQPLTAWPARRLAVAAAFTLGTAVVVFLLSLTAPFRYLELKAYDSYLSQLPPRGDHRIALVLIDDKSQAAFREPLVLWNRHYADLFRGLAAAGAKVVGVDVFFAISLDGWLPGQDGLLSRAYLESTASPTAVILGYEAGQSLAGTAPVYMLAAVQNRIGFLNLTQDRDDYIRRQELYAPSASGDSYSFALQLAAHFLRQEPAQVVAPFRPALDQDRALRIAYRGLGSFSVTSFADAVEAARRNDTVFLRQRFGDRAVLIGTDTVEDRHATPASWARGARMNGVEIHAHAVSTLLDADPVREADRRWSLALLLGTLAGAVLAAIFRSPLFGAAVSLFFVAAVIVAGALLMRRFVFLSPVEVLAGVPLAFAAAVSYRSVVEDRGRRRLRRIFAQYVPDNVIDEILAAGAEQFAGKRVSLTVLFSDVRDFTTISESLQPEALMAQLNQYFAAMTEIVVTHGGVVDKFIGDGLLALFGAPVPHADHARRALQAAREMQQALAGLNRQWAAEGRPQFRIGIGLHTGEAVVGNLGSERKIEYTALGDTVNVASRVESATKNFSAGILISEDTLHAIGDALDAEDVGEQALKGKTQPVRLYRIARRN